MLNFIHHRISFTDLKVSVTIISPYCGLGVNRFKGPFFKRWTFSFFFSVFWKIEDLEKEVKVLKEIGKICGDNLKWALNWVALVFAVPSH